MAFSIVVAGDTVYRMDTAGAFTALSLPSNISVDQTRTPRMAVLGRVVVIVNGLTRSVAVYPDSTVRPMQLTPQVAAPNAIAGGSGGLSGTFRVKMTNCLKDIDTGQLLLESDFSQVSADVTVSSKVITVNGIQVCPDNLAGVFRRLYRTTTGPGTAYFKWVDLDGNEQTSLSDDMPDAGLSLFAAPTEVGVAPGMIPGTYMTLLVEWKGRLWGVGDVEIDKLRYSGDNIVYGWPASYGINVNPVGADAYGITGLIRRRDELGICRRQIIWKVQGTGPSNFSLVKVVEGKGCFAPDSISVIRDVGYFLGEDGVYTWGPDGVKSISDEKVKGWFCTDTYFNRSRFPQAFGHYNAKYHCYELALSAAGSSVNDRWVSYDIERQEWLGPHRTTAFTPTYATQFIDANDLTVPIMGSSDGYIYKQNQATFNDNGDAITLNLIGKAHSCDAPDITKIFNDLSIVQKAQSGQGNLQIGVALGAYDQAVSKTFSNSTIPATDLRKSRQRFNNLGPGRNVRLEFTEATLNQGCELHGYEIPFGVLGRR